VAEGYCPACGKYMPFTLDGEQRVHDCGRTPPLDGLPIAVCACPICGGHGRYRWGCWGSDEHPHEHAHMRPIHELIRGQNTLLQLVDPGLDSGSGLW
jgi:hypothetical protein